MRLMALEKEWETTRPAQKRSRKKRKLDGLQRKSKHSTGALPLQTNHTPSDGMDSRKTAELRSKQRENENKPDSHVGGKDADQEA